MTQAKLEPKSVFDFFAQINKIPRPSGKEDNMMNFLVDFAKSHGLEYATDATGNVLIRKPASPGMEDRKTTVLQSHMDMVCEKVAGLQFDFLKDAIQTEVDGDWMRAKGTTLGADDGIGDAIELAVLADDTIQHGPLECLFTRSEETSLAGARGLSADLLKGDYLINLDSEDEGQIFISCAGGANTRAYFDLSYEPLAQDAFTFKMQIKGLVGGHSGDDINKGRANANILLVRLLYTMMQQYDLRLVDIQSGGLHNAIPRDGYAICAVSDKDKEKVRTLFNTMAADFEHEYAQTEKSMEFILQSQPVEDRQAIERQLGQKIVKACLGVRNGVFAMSQDIPNFVETSSNLASIKITEDEGHKVVKVETMQRSNLTSKRLAACDAVSCVFQLAGARVDVNTGYPGWQLDPKSPLLQIAVDAYERLFGHKPEVKAIHAGLECGLFSEKYPHMDMVSFGPTLRGVLSPDERLLIPTVKMVWDLLLEILKQIPKK